MVTDFPLTMVIFGAYRLGATTEICQNVSMRISILTCVSALCVLSGCSQENSPSGASKPPGAVIANVAVDEASGLQASRLHPGTWFVHNDDGAPRVFAMSTQGEDLGSFEIDGAGNRDWEDMTGFRHEGRDYLVIADTGDNFAQWDEISLNFVLEPEPGDDGQYSGTIPLSHRVSLRYPDGPRDCEAVAFDPASQRILLLTKRDVPPRLYAIDIDTALAFSIAELEFLGESVRFRPPTSEDFLTFGARDGQWVSQPTGMDIDASGTRAAVISYRSVYVFERAAGMSWLEALAVAPTEFEGPPANKEESIAFSRDGDYLLITTEGVPAPIFKLPLDQR
jgi:hypothetical protein